MTARYLELSHRFISSGFQTNQSKINTCHCFCYKTSKNLKHLKQQKHKHSTKKIHNSCSHTLSCATAQHDKLDMFMKIGWHKTSYLLTPTGRKGEEKSCPLPDVNLSWKVLKTHQAHEEDTVKKHLTFKEDCYLERMHENYIRRATRCLAVSVSSKHAEPQAQGHCLLHRLEESWGCG